MDTPSADNGRDLRVGIIGAGGHASSKIYPNLRELPVRLAAVCDLDEARARHNARVFGAEAVYTDHFAMLRDAGPDAVIVCVGGAGHAKLAIDAMEAGIPVYTEKPPALSSLDSAVMLETSRRTGRTCMTGYMKRFAPVYQRARAAVQDDDFGTPSLLAITWSFGVNEQAWLDEFLVDFGVHMIDLARYFFGEIDEVYARDREGIAYAITLGFANGAVGTLSMTANRGYDITERTELTGGYGNHVSIDSTGRFVRYRGGGVADFHERPFSMQDSLTDAGYRGELAEFVDAVRSGREPESSIASSHQTMRVHDAIRRSAAERRIVAVDEI